MFSWKISNGPPHAFHISDLEGKKREQLPKRRRWWHPDSQRNYSFPQDKANAHLRKWSFSAWKSMKGLIICPKWEPTISGDAVLSKVSLCTYETTHLRWQTSSYFSLPACPLSTWNSHSLWHNSKPTCMIGLLSLGFEPLGDLTHTCMSCEHVAHWW